MKDPRIPDGKKFLSRFSIWQGVVLGVGTGIALVKGIVKGDFKPKKPVQKLGCWICPFCSTVLQDARTELYCPGCNRYFKLPKKYIKK